VLLEMLQVERWEPVFSTNGTFPKSRVPVFSTIGTFWKLCLTSHHWNSFHLDTQAAWDLLSEVVKAIILGLLKDPAMCSLNDLRDPTAQGDLQVHALLGEQPILLQGIHHELVDMAKLDSASANVFELDNVLWMNPCLLLANFLTVTSTIAKPHVSGKSTTMAAKLFASDSQSSAFAFDPVPHDFNGKQLFVESIGGEESSAANAYGEASTAVNAYGEKSSAANAYGQASSAANTYGEEPSAAQDYVKLLACAASASLHLDPGCYHSSAFVSAQAGFHLHGFVQLLVSALSSVETIGHQHPLLLNCTAMHLAAIQLTAMHLTQHGNGVFDILKCSKFFEASNLINHVLF